MSQIATLEPNNVTTEPKRGKRDRISPRVKRAIRALLTGEATTQKEAAKLVDLSESHLSTQLNKPNVKAFYERATLETIGRARMRATSKLLSLVDASSEHVAADVAKHVLAINGIKPQAEAQIVNNINQIAGYVVDLGGLIPAAPVVDVTPNEPSND